MKCVKYENIHFEKIIDIVQCTLCTFGLQIANQDSSVIIKMVKTAFCTYIKQPKKLNFECFPFIKAAPRRTSRLSCASQTGGTTASPYVSIIHILKK